MRFLSVCSGIEAASVASAPLGWEAAGFAEIDPFCRALLKEKYPNTPLYGDFTTIQGEELGPVDAIVGGTPCQDFSVAGKRAGLDGARGNLTLEFVRLVGRALPRWVFWENVPGVLSIDNGRAFGAFLGALGKLGYGYAHRVLDAQYFGVPQRRRRVFVVGYLGDWRPAAAVLFERESLSGHPPPRRQAGQGTASEPDEGIVGSLCARDSKTVGNQFVNEGKVFAAPVAMCLNAKGGGGRIDAESETFVPMVAPCLTQNYGKQPDNSDTSAGPMLVAQTHGMAVRRLTPTECERLQGFPDGYTAITYRGKPAADGPRYKALGNSWAVPVVRWIFERMDAVDRVIR